VTTSSATAVLAATSAPTGHLTALEHRPDRLRKYVLPNRPRPVVWEVTREFYEPRELVLVPPASN
jgi:hypothetical protein